MKKLTLLLCVFLGASSISHAQSRTVCDYQSGDATPGGGSFGRWISDDHGLPAYDFAPAIEPPDAWHQIGNSAIKGLVHSAGNVELFTARTFPRFANKIDPATQSWGGGFGWIADATSTWSTLVPDAPAGSVTLRRFGAGYSHRELTYHNLKIGHVVFAPDGDDEVLLETLVFTNTGSTPISFSYFDYWDVAHWLLRASPGFEWGNVVTQFDPSRQAIKAISTNMTGNPFAVDALSDPSPKATFVSVLNTSLDGFDTVQAAFVGSGTRALPAAVAARRLGGSLSTNGQLAQQNATLVTQKNIALQPGATTALYMLFGVAPVGKQDTVIDSYRASYVNRLPNMLSRWASTVPAVRVANAPWIQREMAWNYYYLASGSVFEDYFGQHIINQGGEYLYSWGQNVALRDPLQHAMPLTYIQPSAMRETLLYVLRATRANGQVPYGTSGHGALSAPFFANPSDMALWLIWATAEYVDATRDYAFLDTLMVTYDGWITTVWNLLAQAFTYQVNTVGIGRHGLIKIRHSDWNDTLSLGAPDPIGTNADGESTLNTAFALFIYPRLSSLAARRLDFGMWYGTQLQIANLNAALQAQWRGSYFNRAYLNANASLEVGASNIWLESNGAALSVPGLPAAQASAIVQHMKTQLYDPSPVGLMIQETPLSAPLPSPPWSWLSVNGWTIAGLATWANQNPLAASLAWGEFFKNTLAHHAESYPSLWYGIWSGPDYYFSEAFDAYHAGETTATYPTANMHAHSQPLLSSIRLAGVRVSTDGFSIDPVPPYDCVSWSSPTIKVEYTPTDASGWIRTIGADRMALKIKIPAGLSAATSVQVNGVSVPFTAAGRYVTVAVNTTAGGTLAWSVR